LRHRPTERISRDFVPWRFSDAGRRSVGLGRRSRRPKTCTDAVPNWGNNRGQPVLASHETPLLHPDFLEDDVTGE